MSSGEVTGLVPAAGLGTRMVPATKETPKEMLPVPVEEGGGLLFKPFIQLVFEELYRSGVRTFVFVVGRGKRILQDHFVVDWSFQRLLEEKGKKREAEALRQFYEMIENSTIIWVDQPEPLGLGDAVLRGVRAVTSPRVLVHLGDILLHSPAGSPLTGLIRAADRCGCPGALSLVRVEDPRSYGVAVPGETLRCGDIEALRLETLVEKPREPPSDLAIAGVYLLPTRYLLGALESSPRNPRTGELELTDALRTLAREPGLCGVVAEGADYLDIGRPSEYLRTIMRLSGGARC